VAEAVVSAAFSPDALALDPNETVQRLTEALRQTVLERLRKRGVVVGVSGGIDSSVTVALCAHAFGAENVLALLMPERDSERETLRLSRLAADRFGVPTEVEEITAPLEALGCYRRRDEAFADVIPGYEPGWKAKIVLPPITGGDSFRIFSAVARSPEGETVRRRLSAPAYRQIVAATNFKQRVRKLLEYYHADRLDYAVVGTPNRLEHDLGFFVRNGDGAADVKPIAELYKTQVYALAAHLGVPEEIRLRTPTTDTYPLAQDQEEFYFALPFDRMDLCLYGRLNGVPETEIAAAAGLSADDVARVYRDIDAKRQVAQALDLPPLTFA
jgi:NAD+ synthase